MRRGHFGSWYPSTGWSILARSGDPLPVLLGSTSIFALFEPGQQTVATDEGRQGCSPPLRSSRASSFSSTFAYQAPRFFLFLLAKFGSRRPSLGPSVTSINPGNDQSIILLLAFYGVPRLNRDPREIRSMNSKRYSTDPSYESISRSFFFRLSFGRTAI